MCAVRIRSFSYTRGDVAGPVIKAMEVRLAGRLSKALFVITIEGESI